MTSGLASSFPFLIAAAFQATAPAPKPQVGVDQQSRGCFHHDEQHRDWILEGDTFRCGERKLSRDEMDALRRAVVSARHEVPELLTDVGVTRESLAAHRDTILATVMPEAFKAKAGKAGAKKPEIPPEIEPLLAWERVAPLIRVELVAPSWGSTESKLVRVTFALDGHEVVAESQGLVPWMLPWTIRVDGKSTTSEDLAVPRAVLPLLDPKGPCVGCVDGSAWWPDRFWTDENFWDRVVGRDLDAALSEQEYTRLAGWERASTAVTVKRVMTGMVNLQAESMFFELESKHPAALDAARWHDLLVDGKPAQSWDDFLAIYERACACAAKQVWLMEWKRLDPKRTVELEAAGTKGVAETMVEMLVQPAWKDAGFAGEPEFEILLRDHGRCVGTIYLSSQVSGALVESANPDRAREKGALAVPPTKPSAAHHWFDDLAFSFHPKGNPPTYARVDGEGKVEVRTMERAKGR